MQNNPRPNPAVFKSMLRQLSKEEFAQYAMLFGNQVQEAKPKSQAYFYYFKLYTWCQSYYQTHFIIAQPTLF